MSIQTELKSFKSEWGITYKEYCSKEENEEFMKLEKQKQKLPEDVRKQDYCQYYRIKENPITQDEIKNLIMNRQTKYLSTIKNCAVYFVTMSIIGLSIFLISLLYGLALR